MNETKPYVKILEEGILPEEEIHKLRCHHCKTNFEFNGAAADFRSSQRDGDFLQIQCPHCRRDLVKNLLKRVKG